MNFRDICLRTGVVVLAEYAYLISRMALSTVIYSDFFWYIGTLSQELYKLQQT
jgi:hypothetical protein